MINTGKIYRMLVAGAVMLLAAGCSYVEDPGRPCPPVESDGNVHLNFVMTSDAKLTGGTRSDDQNHTEIGSDQVAGYDMEEAIDLNQLAFYIFVGEGPDAKLLYSNDDINHTTDPYTMITGAQGQYNVTVSLPNEMLEQITGHPLDASSDETITFRMVALANAACGFDRGNPYNPSKNPFYDNYYPGHPEGIPSRPGITTYAEVIAAAEKFDYLVEDLYGGSEDNYGDTAQGVWKGAIPMFGTLTASVSEKNLCASRPYERIFFGDVWLLRSLAKIRVYDKISEKTGGFPRLHSAVLTFATPRGYMLPADALGYVNGTQVHTPRTGIPGSDTSFNFPFLSSESRFLIGYLPEQTIKDATPYLIVRIQTAPFVGTENQNELKSYNPVFPPTTSQEEKDLEFALKTRTFTVPLWGYNGQQFTWGDQILRNHVYDINVDYKNGALLTLRATVNDWTQNSLELDFMQNPVVSQTVEWVTDTYSRIDNTTGQLYLKPWDNDGNRTAAKCTFTIGAPKDAEWTAYLVTTAGNPGAFAFKIGESGGAAVTAETVSGKTGESATLEIVSVNPAPTEDNSAILQVVVAMDGGTRFMEARVAGGAIKNWTVNQAKQ